MKLLDKFIPDKKTRLKLTICSLIANFIIVVIGLLHEASITDLGTGLALLNAPLYAFLLAETIRPSMPVVDELKK
jgi:hypothetical protein